jgi:hypothetical protein
MSDLAVLWAAYGFAFGALGLYLAYLWNETRKLWVAESSLGIARRKNGAESKEGGAGGEG